MENGMQVMPDVKVVQDTRSAEYRREVDKASREFEGILLAQLFRVMRSSVMRSELLGGDNEREIYEDMLFTEIARASARAEGMGISEMLYRQLVDGPPAGRGGNDEPSEKTQAGAPLPINPFRL